MSENRVNFFALMSLVSDILKQLSYEDLISKFVNRVHFKDYFQWSSTGYLKLDVYKRQVLISTKR